MKNTFKKIIAAVVCLALASACMFTFASCDNDDGISVPAFSDDTIKIGASGPLTGGAAVYGQAVYNSARLAVSEINEQGGLNGVLFSFEMYDDQHKPETVATGYANLFGKGMQISLGCVTTGPCLEYASLSKADNLFFMTPSASADAVPAEDNAYQMCFADGNQGTVAANYVNSLGLSKIGIFYMSDDDYSRGIYEKFKEQLNDSITTVEASFTESTQSDFSTQVDTLKECDFIFMPIYYTPASLFMTQAIGKVADDAVYYGCDGFDGIESADGFDISVVPQKVQMLSHFNSKATSGAAKDFVDKYTEHFGTDTLNQFGAAAYDCVWAIYEALVAATEAGATVNASTSASDMCELLKAQFNGGFTYSGVTGDNIKWEASGYVNKQAVAYVIKEAN